MTTPTPEPLFLDASGLLCPMPVIRLQALAKTAPPGSSIRILCTDPGAQYDIPAWCRVHKHRLLNINLGVENLVIDLQLRS